MELWLLLEASRERSVADAKMPAVGEGDKQLLRRALLMLGLPRASKRAKRAIQFGTRLGKLANMQAFGSNRSAEARHAGTMSLADLQSMHDLCLDNKGAQRILHEGSPADKQSSAG